MLKGHMLRSKKETNLQTSGLARKNQWAQWVQFVDILPVCSPHLEPWVFSGPHVGHQNVVLKQTVGCASSKDGFLWNQQRIAIWVLQSCEPCASPMWKWRENSFMEGKRNLEGLESMDFHWLSPCLEIRVFLPVIVLCYGHRVRELPFLAPQL